MEDKVTNEEYQQGTDAIFIDREVDRIYSNPSKRELNVTLTAGEDRKVNISAAGYVDGEQVSVSAVVWNPYIDKANSLSDFGDEEYHDMICVEPGMLKNLPSLDQGKEAVFIQKITAL